MSMKHLFILVLWALCIQIFTNKVALAAYKWNKKREKFEPTPETDLQETNKDRIVWHSLQEEKHNFNGQPLHITYFENPSFFRFYDNDTKATAICGDIWTTLSEHLNFSLVLEKRAERSLGLALANGSFAGILEYARLNQTDVIPILDVYISRVEAVKFTPVFWMNSQRIFASGQWKRNRAWMFTLFRFEVWCVIFIFIVALSLANIFTQSVLIHHTHQNLRARSCLDHLFYTFATLCNQGHMLDNTGSGSRILTLTIGVFSWLTLIGYSSRLIYNMAQEVFDAPFKDLDTLYADTNFRIVVLEGAVAHLNFESPDSSLSFTRMKAANRVTVVPNLTDLYETVCSNPDEYVLMHGGDAVAARGRRFCRLIPVGVSYFITPIASGISKRVKNKRSIDIGIMKLREFGLIDAIKKRYMSSYNNEAVVRQANSLAIDMDRVYLIFALLLIGIIASIVICALENLVFALGKRNNLQSLGRRFPAIKQRLFGTPEVARRENKSQTSCKYSQLSKSSYN